jgi:hypothetical protein
MNLILWFKITKNFIGGRSVNIYGRFLDFIQESFSFFTDWLVDPKYITSYEEKPS